MTSHFPRRRANRPVGCFHLLVWLMLAVPLLAPRLATAASAAQAAGSVRIFDRPAPEGLELVVANTNLAAVTLNVTFLLENATPDRPGPYVVTCAGRTNVPFVRLRPVKAGADLRYRLRFDWQFGDARARHDPTVVYELPFPSGKRFLVSQGFRGAFSHTGNNEFAVDFAMPEGTAVLAARGGVVQAVVDRFERGGPDPALRDQVNMILIRHPDGTLAEYAHLKKKGVRVKPGQEVKAREIIGISGSTGYAEGPHLHFAVYRPVDGLTRQTFPPRFRTRAGGPVEPRQGEALTAP